MTPTQNKVRDTTHRMVRHSKVCAYVLWLAEDGGDWSRSRDSPRMVRFARMAGHCNEFAYVPVKSQGLMHVSGVTSCSRFLRNSYPHTRIHTYTQTYVCTYIHTCIAICLREIISWPSSLQGERKCVLSLNAYDMTQYVSYSVCLRTQLMRRINSHVYNLRMMHARTNHSRIM